MDVFRGIFSLLLVSGVAREGLAEILTKVPCEPGELVFIDCNLCTCNRQGFPNQVCAKMWCPPPLYPSKPAHNNPVM